MGRPFKKGEAVVRGALSLRRTIPAVGKSRVLGAVGARRATMEADEF